MIYALILLVVFALGVYAGRGREQGMGWGEITSRFWHKISDPFRRKENRDW